MRWVPDHAVSHCQACGVEFWTGLRKHHCRYSPCAVVVHVHVAVICMYSPPAIKLYQEPINREKECLTMGITFRKWLGLHNLCGSAKL